jgi:hypothetical protein
MGGQGWSGSPWRPYRLPRAQCGSRPLNLDAFGFWGVALSAMGSCTHMAFSFIPGIRPPDSSSPPPPTKIVSRGCQVSLGGKNHSGLQITGGGLAETLWARQVPQSPSCHSGAEALQPGPTRIPGSSASLSSHPGVSSGTQGEDWAQETGLGRAALTLFFVRPSLVLPPSAWKRIAKAASGWVPLNPHNSSVGAICHCPHFPAMGQSQWCHLMEQETVA